jgi:translation initiation factor 6 (eIF-6)
MTPGSGAAGSVSDIGSLTSTTSQTEDSSIADTYTVTPADGTFTTGSSSGFVVGIVINSNKFVRIDDLTSTYPILRVGEITLRVTRGWPLPPRRQCQDPADKHWDEP